MTEFEMRGRLIVQAMWTELEKIAEADGKPLEEDPDKEEMVDPEEVGESPVSGVVGSRIVQKGLKARGIPVFDPPEGYEFRPELQAFAPSEDDSWMTQDRALGGQAVQNAYNKGREDEQTEAASNEIRRNVDQSVVQMQQEQAAQQAQPPMQQQAAQPTPQAPVPPKVNAPGNKAVKPPKIPSARVT